MFDLRSFREDALKLTQKELADLIDERQDKISRLEKNPVTIGLDILIKIADKTGTTLDELVHYKKQLPDPLQIEDTWSMVTVVRKTINDYIASSLETKITNDQHRQLARDIEELTGKSLTKPKVAIVGLSDTGKSTLINGLLGSEKMPAAWTPTTAISIYIKHIDDRPSYITDDVWFFKTQLDQEVGWNPKCLEDKAYTNDWVAKKGHIQDLNEFAVRRAWDDGLIGSAVVFVDSPILKVCDIVDLPGYNTGDRQLDNTLTEQVRTYADVLIYMSLANGFMGGNDIEYIKGDLNCLPIIEHRELNNNPLGNLFVIASQAHVVNKGNRENLDKILDEGARRLYTQIPEEVWAFRSEVTGMTYSMETLRSRFFTYTKDIEDLRTPFESELVKFIERYPNLLINQYKGTFAHLCEMNKIALQGEIKSIQEIINHRGNYGNLIKGLKTKELGRTQASETLRGGVVDKIKALSVASNHDFIEAYGQLISVDSVINMIDEEGYTNVKGDMELLGSLLNSKLQSRVHQILKERSLEFSEAIHVYLDDYDGLVDELFAYDQSGVKSSYDTKRAFSGGLKGVSAIGGLAVWGASLGDLTAYLLLGKEVNVLSALLYSVFFGAEEDTFSAEGRIAYGGSFTALTSGDAISLGIGLAILAVTTGLAVFGTGWKKSTAKKIVAAFRDERVYQTYNAAISTYWAESDNAFELASQALEKGYLNQIEGLKVKVDTDDVTQLESSIDEAKDVIEFYNNMPLSGL